MDIALNVTRKRRPRFRRVNTSELPLALTERDFYGLKWLYERRLMTSELLCRVMPGSDQRKLRRFQKWYHHGLIERLRTGLYNEPFWLAVTDRGADLVCARYGLPRGKIDWDKKNLTLHDYLFREHTVGISRFCVAVDQGIRHLARLQAEEAFARYTPAEQDEALFAALGYVKRRHTRAVTWNNEMWAQRARQKVLDDVGAVLTPRVRLADEGEGLERQLWFTDEAGVTRAITPDLPFTLIHENDALDFALEWDRSTIPLERTSEQRDMLQKFRRYWLFYKQEREKARQGLPARNQLRVLTVCRSEQRAAHLRQLARRADDAQTGSTMFWFAHAQRLALAEPGGIWQGVWQTARDEQGHQLLE